MSWLIHALRSGSADSPPRAPTREGLLLAGAVAVAWDGGDEFEARRVIFEGLNPRLGRSRPGIG